MNFNAIELKGAYLIDPEPIEDERGFFARAWCAKEFVVNGLVDRMVQCNISFNYKKGTLRGMHLQKEPYAEAKLVRCTQGAIWDVIIDLREDSKTYLKHFSIELSSENRRMLYVPEGMAHGFITLKDHTEIFYQMSEFYSSPHALGYRYNDPAFGIEWPLQINTISDRDRNYSDYFIS